MNKRPRKRQMMKDIEMGSNEEPFDDRLLNPALKGVGEAEKQMMRAIYARQYEKQQKPKTFKLARLQMHLMIVCVIVVLCMFSMTPLAIFLKKKYNWKIIDKLFGLNDVGGGDKDDNDEEEEDENDVLNEPPSTSSSISTSPMASTIDTQLPSQSMNEQLMNHPYVMPPQALNQFISS